MTNLEKEDGRCMWSELVLVSMCVGAGVFVCVDAGVFV